MATAVAADSTHRRWRNLDVFWLAAGAAAWPFALATIRAIRRGWYPTGDVGIVAVRAQDVFSRNPPLLGTWSSASLWAKVWINHPGALQFDVLAVPVRLLGVGPGVAIGTAATNAAAVLTAGWLARRRAGTLAGTITLVLAASLAWSMGSEILYDGWSQFAPLFPFLCFLFAAWSVADGDVIGLPIAAFAAGFLLQTHLSYVLLVPGVSVCAVGAFAWSQWRDRRADRHRWRKGRTRLLSWIGATVAILIVTWFQPLYEELTRNPGNLSNLMRAAARKPPTTPGLGGALQAVADVVALPPWWLPSSWENPAFELDGSGRPVLLVSVAVVILVGGLAVLLVLSVRKNDRTAATAVGSSLVVLALVFASVAKSNSPDGLVATYVRWLWPAAVFTWFSIGLAIVRLRAPAGTTATEVRPRSDRRWSPVTLGLGSAAVVLAALATPPVDHGSSTFAWASSIAKTVERTVIPELRGKGTVLVQIRTSVGPFQVGPAVLSMMRSANIPVLVDNEELVRQLGERRRYQGKANEQMVISGGLGVLDAPEPGWRRLVTKVGLDPAQRRQLAGLRDTLLGRIRRAGGIEQDPSVGPLRQPTQSHVDDLVALSRADPEKMIDEGDLLNPDALYLGDLDALGHADVVRFKDLQQRLRDQSLAVDVRSL